MDAGGLTMDEARWMNNAGRWMMDYGRRMVDEGWWAMGDG